MLRLVLVYKLILHFCCVSAKRQQQLVRVQVAVNEDRMERAAAVARHEHHKPCRIIQLSLVFMWTPKQMLRNCGVLQTEAMIKKLVLLLLFCSVLTPPAPAAASSQVAVILFFCSIAAVVPGPWQQPLQYVSSHKDTLLPGISFFILRLLLMIVLASILQKLVRFDALKFASLSLYSIPVMSLALLVNQSHRQPLIDVLSLSSTVSFLLRASYSALPPSFLRTLSLIAKVAPQGWWFPSKAEESMVSEEGNAAFAVLAIAWIFGVLVLVRIIWTAVKKCILSLEPMALFAIFLSQLSASFILPRVPDIRSAPLCLLCVTQLLTAPYMRNRSLPLPTETNRRLFIVCVIPVAMAYSSCGVESSVMLQAFLDARALFRAAVKRSLVKTSVDPTLSMQSSHFNSSPSFLFISVLVLVLLALDSFYFQVAISYVVELFKNSFMKAVQLDLTFISIFVLSWGANYDAGFPSLLVVMMTLLLPSLKG
jgi:hypothetical protein